MQCQALEEFFCFVIQEYVFVVKLKEMSMLKHI